jgi:hypothetical protein
MIKQHPTRRSAMTWVRTMLLGLALIGAAMLVGCQSSRSTADDAAAMNGQTPQQCDRQKVY